MLLRPPWLYDLFAVGMLVVAAYCTVLFVLSYVARRPAGRDVEVSHVAMGLAMAGMFEPSWAFGPNWMWEIVFLSLLVWFTVRSIQSLQTFGTHLPHQTVHALMSVAMLLMYWYPMGAVGRREMSMSMSATATAGHLDPGLGFIIAFALLASAVFTLASSRKGGVVYGTHTESPAALAAELVGEEPAYLEESVSSVAVAEGAVAPPWLVDLTHVAMCVAMGFMLVLML